MLESLKGGLNYFGDLQYARGIKFHPQNNGAYPSLLEYLEDIWLDYDQDVRAEELHADKSLRNQSKLL